MNHQYEVVENKQFHILQSMHLSKQDEKVLMK